MPSSVVLDAGNWQSGATVTGVDDAVHDGTQAYTIASGAASSDDSRYQGVDPPDVSVSNLDDDTPGIQISAACLGIILHCAQRKTARPHQS